MTNLVIAATSTTIAICIIMWTFRGGKLRPDWKVIPVAWTLSFLVNLLILTAFWPGE